MKMTGFLRGLSLNWKTRRPEITLEVDGDAADIEKLKDKKLSVELKQYREKRSLDANAYYWVLVGKLADVLGQSSAWVHNHMLRKYGQIMVIDYQGVYTVLPDTDEAQKAIDEAETYHLKPTSQVKPGKGGKMYRTYMMLRGSSDYDSKEMSTLINGLVEECKVVGIETLPPAELERMIKAYEKHYAGR